MLAKGRLSSRIINEAPDTASVTELRRRFGKVSRAYELIGYDWKQNREQRFQITLQSVCLDKNGG